MNRSTRTRQKASEQISSEDLTYVQAILFVIASILFFAGSSIALVVASRNVKTKKSPSKLDDILTPSTTLKHEQVSDS